jgi:hypothetical protein
MKEISCRSKGLQMKEIVGSLVEMFIIAVMVEG